MKPAHENIRDSLREEDLRMLKLRWLIDRTTIQLGEGSLSYDDSRKLIEQTRRNVLELFPDKGYLFDLLYRPRFYRILDENFITM
jgi:hypothetical protein